MAGGAESRLETGDHRPQASLHRWIDTLFENVAIRNVTHAHCNQWVEKRGKDLSASSFVQELDTLRLILDHVVSRGLMLSNPTKEIKRRKIVRAKIVVRSRDQFQALILAIHLRNRKNLAVLPTGIVTE